MINAIVIGSGNKRTKVAIPASRELRQVAANKLKGHLFPRRQDYVAALKRGKK